MYLNKEIPSTEPVEFTETVFDLSVENIQVVPAVAPFKVLFNRVAKGTETNVQLLSPGDIGILETGTYHISFSLAAKRDEAIATIGSMIAYLSINNLTSYGFGGQNTSPNFGTPLCANYDVCIRLLAGEIVRCYIYNKSLAGDITLNPIGRLYNSNLVITRVL